MREIRMSGSMSGEGKPPAASRPRSSALPRLHASRQGPFCTPLEKEKCRPGSLLLAPREVPWMEGMETGENGRSERRPFGVHFLGREGKMEIPDREESGES